MWKYVKSMLFSLVLSVVILTVSHRDCVHGARPSDSAAKRLAKQLSEDYGSPSIRPVLDYVNQPVNVSFRIHIAKVVDFDERQQRITLEAWRRQSWVDEFLQWNSSEAGGLESIILDHKLIWKPDIKLIENVDDDFINVFDNDAIVASNGSVTWFTPIVVTTHCKVNIRYFPFDSQTCQLTFQSWGYDSSNLVLTHFKDDDVTRYRYREEEDVNMTILHQNGVWTLKIKPVRAEVVTTNGVDYAQIIYSLVLDRYATFYVLNIVIPSWVLASLTCLVFTLPSESGERLTFSFTNLLATILFQQLVSDIMPPLGDDLSILGILFLIMIFLDCLAVALTITLLWMFHHHGDTKVPAFLLKFLRFKISDVCCALCVDQNDDVPGIEAAANGKPVKDAQAGNAQTAQPTQKPATDAQTAQPTQKPAADAQTTQMKEHARNWKAISRKLNNYIGAFFAIVTVLVLVIFIFLLTIH